MIGRALANPQNRASGAPPSAGLAPVIERLTAENIPISVDSFLPDTQRFAVAHGVACLNDIQGFPDRDLYPALAAADCRLIVTHSVQLQGPATKVATDPATIWASIDRFFVERLAALQAAGVAQQRLIIDPGLGYFLAATRRHRWWSWLPSDA